MALPDKLRRIIQLDSERREHRERERQLRIQAEADTRRSASSSLESVVLPVLVEAAATLEQCGLFTRVDGTKFADGPMRSVQICIARAPFPEHFATADHTSRAGVIFDVSIDGIDVIQSGQVPVPLDPKLPATPTAAQVEDKIVNYVRRLLEST